MHKAELIVLGVDGGLSSYVREKALSGELPNFAVLLQDGCMFDDLRPAHPSITPVCWSSFQTGAVPEIHGVTSDQLHPEDGSPLSKVVTGYHGDHLQAQRFWESAAEIGKTSLVVSMPVSGPARSKGVRQIQGTSCVPPVFTRPDEPTSPEYRDIPQQVWFFNPRKYPVSTLDEFSMKSSPVVALEEGFFRLEVSLDGPRVNPHHITGFSWIVQVTGEGFVLASSMESLHAEKTIRFGDDGWSQTVYRILESGEGTAEYPFRFGCFEFKDGFALFAFASSDMKKNVSPGSFASLMEHLSLPPPSGEEYVFLHNPETAVITYTSWDHCVDWHIEVIRRALEHEESNILIDYLPFTDTVNHLFLGQLKEVVKTPGKYPGYVQEVYRRAYAAIDRFLGFLRNEVATENALVLVVSDHGGIGVNNSRSINQILADAGLLVWKSSLDQSIDWSRTRAALVTCGHIYVNLKGRDQGGIVPESEYRDTVGTVIAALQEKLRDDQGNPYLAFAVERSEAGFFGLGSHCCGDVVYGLAGNKFGGMYGGVHAEQMPTAQTESGSMRCLGIIAGHGITGNTTLKRPVYLWDLAPTLCRLKGYPQPREATGAVISTLIPNPDS